HGLDHDLLYNKTNEEFKKQIIEAKKILESIVGEDTVLGYRASCFSMDREKLDILKECGYEYDSSYISFAQHPLYGSLDLSGYEEVDDLIYKNGSFVEFEIPTYKLGKYNIPISGGGYLRLFPYSIIKYLINNFLKTNKNFVLYLHPFELTDVALLFSKNTNFKDKTRDLIGRKGNLKKLEKILSFLLRNGIEFSTLQEEYWTINNEVKQ